MYLHGMSSGDFVPALEEFFGGSAGLSSSVITRLTKQWQAERDAFMRRDLSKVDYVYVWVDGIHFNIRLEEERLCTLVVGGVRAAPPRPASRRGSRLPLDRSFAPSQILHAPEAHADVGMFPEP